MRGILFILLLLLYRTFLKTFVTFEMLEAILFTTNPFRQIRLYAVSLSNHPHAIKSVKQRLFLL